MSEPKHRGWRLVPPLYVSILALFAFVTALCGGGFLFLLFVVPIGDSQTKLSGDVVGPDGKPLTGARVRLAMSGSEREKEVVTDDSGQYSVSVGHHSGNDILVVTVAKDGYRTYRREFKAADEWGGAPKRIVLEPEGPAGQKQ